jgi:hypothetical protein
LESPLKPFRTLTPVETDEKTRTIRLEPSKMSIYNVDQMISNSKKFFENTFKSFPEELVVKYLLAHELGHVLWNFKKFKMIEEVAKSEPKFEEAVLKLASSYSEYEEEFSAEQLGHVLTLLREKSKEKLREVI